MFFNSSLLIIISGVLHASVKEITLFLSNEFLSQLFTKVNCNTLMPTQAFRHEVMRFLLLSSDRELEIGKTVDTSVRKLTFSKITLEIKTYDAS